MKHYAEIVGGIALALLGVFLFIALLAWGCLEFIHNRQENTAIFSRCEVHNTNYKVII